MPAGISSGIKRASSGHGHARIFVDALGRARASKFSGMPGRVPGMPAGITTPNSALLMAFPRNVYGFRGFRNYAKCTPSLHSSISVTVFKKLLKNNKKCRKIYNVLKHPEYTLTGMFNENFIREFINTFVLGALVHSHQSIFN